MLDYLSMPLEHEALVELFDAVLPGLFKLILSKQILKEEHWSPISPQYIPHISPMSPPYLPYVSPISPLYLSKQILKEEHWSRLIRAHPKPKPEPNPNPNANPNT